MKIFILTLFFLFAISHLSAFSPTRLREGDLLFQDLDCGPLCDAIETVTQGTNNHRFSHVAMVFKTVHDTVWVIEAIGKGVQITPLSKFVKRSGKPIMIGRLKRQYRYMIPQALRFAQAQSGKPYDDIYTYGDEKYYCSELIYEAFKYAHPSRPVFSLSPMTFKIPGQHQYYPAWVDYFAGKGVAIPEGAPGCNPGGISRSKALRIFKTYLNTEKIQ